MNSVSNRFHELANGSIRPLDWEVGISWTKARDENRNWFTLNKSQLNSTDILGIRNDQGMQPWDAYNYTMVRDRVIDLNVERSVEFPYNIQSAICDTTIDNHDGYFTYGNIDSPLHNYILPARPIRVYLGFTSGGLTPIFVGLTEGIPKYNGRNNSTMQITALDFLSELGKTSLQNMIIMRDVRTDEVIAEILRQCGLKDYMFKLDRGLNTIPFVFFDSGKNAGNALKELVQAENGVMWMDENGVIRFSPRTQILGEESVMIFSPSNIISITPSQTDDIVNKVYIEADIRKVENFQQIFSADNSTGYNSTAEEDPYRLKANQTTTIWINFEDPIWRCAANPILNGNAGNSSFTAIKLNGDRVTGGITAVGILFATALKIDFKNLNDFPVSVDYLQIWGEPAKIVGGSPTIKYTAQDDESIEKFGIKELNITDNTCFGNYQNIDSYATYILEHYSGFSPTLELEVKGDPALQLQDIITLQDTDYDGTWMIKSISHKLEDTKLTTRMKVIRHEILYPFILNHSRLNGKDVLD